jgi:uncharacterized cupredoxin-like copper-binding protein
VPKWLAAAFVLAVAGASGLGLARATTGSAASHTSVARKVVHVTVVASEFKFKLSRKSVPLGKVVFTVKNRGKLPHDFKIAGKKTHLVKPGKQTTLTVVFRKKKSYPYLCTVAGHAAAGMKGKLKAGAATRAVSKATRVAVAAKEFRFALSRRAVPVGKVVFVVTNKGKIAHDFRIAGKKTPVIAPGHHATLTVVFKHAGEFSYVCTLPGHAAAGMKGALHVGSSAAVTTTAPPPATTAPTVAVGNASTTVTVGMYEYRFALSSSTIPSGRVTFVITNNGSEVHNFDVLGHKAGAIIGPGKSETWTIALPPGTYGYDCDVPFHADRGMTGQFTVTP